MVSKLIQAAALAAAILAAPAAQAAPLDLSSFFEGTVIDAAGTPDVSYDDFFGELFSGSFLPGAFDLDTTPTSTVEFIFGAPGIGGNLTLNAFAPSQFDYSIINVGFTDSMLELLLNAGTNGPGADDLGLGAVAVARLDFGSDLFAGVAAAGDPLLELIDPLGFGISSYTLDSFTLTELTPIPLPAGLPLLASGIVLLGWHSRRKARAANA